MQLNSFSSYPGVTNNQKDFSSFAKNDPFNVEDRYHHFVEGGDQNPFNLENLYHHTVVGGDDNPFNPENQYHHRLG
ncbi:MAG: hypothetical protein AB7V50_04460 [Vampirovibrionia bacterium]